MSKSIRVRASATVSNLNCGFDVIGLAISDPYDIIELEMTDSGKVEITGISGCDSLSTDPGRNVVGAALDSMKRRSATPAGFRVSIEKGITPGSGIGSSAASAAGAVYGANELMGKIFSMRELVTFAMEGERLASGTAHADNVAPALMGGITLIRSYDPLDIIRINIPPELFCVVIHPDMVIKTSMARGILDKNIPLTTAVKQWGNVGGLVAGLYSEDYDLIGRSLVDHIAEPKRSVLIPGFEHLKETAMVSGALGAGISGSGPSVFALCRGEVLARKVLAGMETCMRTQGIRCDAYLSPVSLEGARVC